MTTKTDTLADLDAAYETLRGVVARFDEAHGTWDEAFDGWSAANVLQHLDGWLVERTEGMERAARGEAIAPVGADYSNVDAWNAKFIEVRNVQGQSMADATAMWERSHAAFRAAAAAVPEARFHDDPAGDGRTPAATVQRHAHHYRAHAEQMAVFLDGAV